MIVDVLKDNDGHVIQQGHVNNLVRYFIADGTGDNIATHKVITDGVVQVSTFIGELETPVGVGNKPGPEVTTVDPKIVLCFNNTQSIDVFIQWLENSKKLLTQALQESEDNATKEDAP